MKLSVLQDDIDNGVRGSNCNCPVALAIKRAMPGAPVVYVGLSVVHVMPRGSSAWIEKRVPLQLRDWMCRFDNNRYVEPIEVEL